MDTCIKNFGQLCEYDVSPETAFVPVLVTALALPPRYGPIEALVSDPPLAHAISSLILRSKVENLPQYRRGDFADLALAEKRRFFVILTFVAHGYVWGNGIAPVKHRLPEQIAIPLDHLSKELGIIPMGTYATTVLWNSRLKDDAEGWILDNVSIDFTFTGTEDESLFYKVSICVEAAGAGALTSLLGILFEIRQERPCTTKMTKLFAEAYASLQEMVKILKKLKMDPRVFFWEIRPLYAGWNVAESDDPQVPKGVQKGVHYAGVDEPSTFRTDLGISAHQSTLFQALDVLLGVSHENGEAYLQELRKHMPSPHVRFLECLRTHFTNTLKTYIKNQPELERGFNECLQSLASFREIHMGLVMTYAVAPASLSGQREFGLAKGIRTGGGLMGAGGTVIKDGFFKRMVRDTRSAQLP